MKNAVAEGVQMPFPVRGLEEENKALRKEIERLRKVLAASGLTSASALTNQHNSDLPVVPNLHVEIEPLLLPRAGIHWAQNPSRSLIPAALSQGTPLSLNGAGLTSDKSLVSNKLARS
jgi:hypothetical protein